MSEVVRVAPLGIESDIEGLSWLKREGGKLVYTEAADSGKNGTGWDVVGHWGRALQPLQEELGLSELRDERDGMIVGSENLAIGVVSEPFRMITRLANEMEDRIGEPDFKLLYVMNFIAGNREALRRGVEEVDAAKTVVLAPERGAWVQKMMLGFYGFGAGQVPYYRASRMMLQSGDYTVAMEIGDEFPGAEYLLHVDDCKAADGTEELAVARWVEMHGLPRKIVSVVGAGVRRSLYRRSQSLEALGVDHRIFFSAESNGMDGESYLTLTYEEARALGLRFSQGWRVGDMGEAMNMSSEERHLMHPLFRELATDDGHDEWVLELTDFAMRTRSLSSAADKVRQRVGSARS